MPTAHMSFTCPSCGKVTEVDITMEEYNAFYQSNASVQDAMPKRDPFFRELFASHMCYDCQSKLFNKPKPGDDWGEQLGECPVCGCPIYAKDDGVCPDCGEGLD